MAIRQRYIFDQETQTMIPIEEYRLQQRVRSGHVVEDTLLEAIRSHATDEGLMFDSRSKYLAHLKQHGFEVTGGDHLTGKSLEDWKPPKATRREILDDVEKCYHDIKWGRTEFNERVKERCLRENRAYQEYAKRQKRGW